MSWDLKQLLAAAGAQPGKPRLVEVARAMRGNRVETTGYFWSTGRIRATAGEGRVRIERVLGVMPRRRGGVLLTIHEVQALAVAARDWARRRHRWAAFYFSGAGYPPGFGLGGWYYEPAGKKERVCLGRHTPTTRAPSPFVGQTVRVATPRPLDAGARVEHELWRKGEHYGPPTGSLVGLRYRIADRLFLEANRRGAQLERQGGMTVHLEIGDEAFVEALCKLLSNEKVP